MASIDNALDDARDAATDFLNAEGRHAGHVALGVLLTVGFALAATAFASRVVWSRVTSTASSRTIGEMSAGTSVNASLTLPIEVPALSSRVELRSSSSSLMV